jgi:hypothetical protein
VISSLLATVLIAVVGIACFGGGFVIGGLRALKSAEESREDDGLTIVPQERVIPEGFKAVPESALVTLPDPDPASEFTRLIAAVLTWNRHHGPGQQIDGFATPDGDRMELGAVSGEFTPLSPAEELTMREEFAEQFPYVKLPEHTVSPASRPQITPTEK